ncbi:MAG: hypothetical protein Q7S57_02600 [bacterium]|nr:hypothetical protein [bacterium]
MQKGTLVVNQSELDMLECLFCRHVFDRARQELGMGTNDCSDLPDDEMLNFVGEMSPYIGCTLRQGYRDLIEYLLQLEGMDPCEASQQAYGLSDVEIAQGIRDIASEFDDFSDWVAHLSPRARAALSV